VEEVKEVVEKYGTGPGGKPYYGEFKDDLRKMQQNDADNQGGISFDVIE